MSNPEVKKLPPPIPGVERIIPLALLPEYLKLHNLESVEYKETEEILIVKRSNPLAR